MKGSTLRKVRNTRIARWIRAHPLLGSTVLTSLLFLFFYYPVMEAWSYSEGDRTIAGAFYGLLVSIGAGAATGATIGLLFIRTLKKRKRDNTDI